MSDTEILIGGQSRPREARWYDQYKVTMVLFSIVGLFIFAWATIVWAKASAAELKNIEQDGQIHAIIEKLDVISKGQEKLNDKQDRILERLPK